MRSSLATLLFVLLAGCANDPYRAMYEGIKDHNEAFKTPSEHAMSPPAPSYDAYNNERKRKSAD